MLETHAHKKLVFNTYRETKMSQVVVFWSNRAIKIPKKMVFRLNREIQNLLKKLRNENAAIFHILQVFCKSLGEWNNRKIWETREILAILHEAAMRQLVYR